MTEVKSVNLKENTAELKDGTIITLTEFKKKFNLFWSKRIAGETISVADMERFMKRGSAKNLKQLIDVKKTEGTLEALIGKKMDPRWIKMILLLALIGIGVLIIFMILPKMGLM